MTLPTEPTRAGYLFDGWFDANNVEVTSNSANDGSDLDLTAGWVGVGYEITLELNGGTGDNSTSWTYGQALAVEAPTLAGYTFSGWYTAATGGTLVTDTATNDVIGERTLYARWNLTSNYFTVSYDRNGGESAAISDQNYTITGTISFPTAPTRTGYTFAGWYTAATAGTRVEAGAAASTTTLYAQWTVSVQASAFSRGYSPETGWELYYNNGISTSIVQDIWPGPDSSQPSSFIAYEGYVYFSANDGYGNHGYELWRTDGTTATLVADINTSSSANGGSYPEDLVIFNDVLYFKAYQPGYGDAMWRLDASASPFAPSVVPGTANTRPRDLTVFGGYIYYATQNDGILYRTNGSQSTQVGGVNFGHVEITGTDQNYLYFTLTEYDGSGDTVTYWRTNESGTISNPSP